MPDVLGELEIRIRAKLDDLDRDFGSAKSKALGHVDDIAEGTKAKIGGAMKSIAGIGAAVAGAFAVVGAGKFLGGALAEMEEAVKTGKQTEAVIKSTGGAANVTAKQVGGLADSLSAMSGIDDEAIAAGENMLLTFTNVQNRVGKGNDIFNQATRVMTDMSVAMGQDMKTTAIQLGKALNDPIKGVTALQRVGVTFTAAQKDQIAAMVQAGDVAGAQKVILAELNKEFGGSAKAQATAADKMKVAWKNLEESAGTAIAPVIGGLANLGARVLPAVAGGIGRFGSQFAEAFSSINKFGQWEAHGPFEKLGKAVALAYNAVRLFFGAFTGKGAGGAGVDALGSWVNPIIDAGSKAREVFESVLGVVKRNWPAISQVISEAVQTIWQVISGVVTVITVIWTNFGSQITAVAQAAWTAIFQVIDGALQVIRGIVKVVTGLIHGDWSMVWEGLKGIVSGAWTAITGYVDYAFTVLRNLFSVGWEIIKGIVTGAWDGIKGAISGAIDAVIGFVESMPGRIASAASGMWDGIKDAFRSAINTIIGWWNGLQFQVPGFSVGPVHFGGFTLGVPDIPYLAKGGIVTGPTLAVIGERGPEAVVPLSSGYRSPRDRLGRLGGGDSGSAMRPLVFNIDPRLAPLIRIVRDEISSAGRHNVDAGVKIRTRR